MPYRWHWNPRELYEPNPLPFITGRRNWSPPEIRVAKLRVTLPRFYQRGSETGSVASTRPSPVLRDGAEFICSSGDKTYTLTWYDVACSPINADLIFWALIFLPEGWPLLAAGAGSKLDLCLGLRCWCALCYRTLRWHMVYGKRRRRTHSSQVYVWQPALTPNIFFFVVVDSIQELYVTAAGTPNVCHWVGLKIPFVALSLDPLCRCRWSDLS